MSNTQQYTDAANASFTVAFGLAGKTLEGVEQLVALNLQSFKSLLAESEEQARSVLSAKSPEDFVKLQAASVQAGSQKEKAAAYGRQVQQVVTGLADAYRAAAEAQAAEAQAKFLAAFDGALQNVPGNENAVALAKQAIAAAKNAYEGVNKASKQVTDAVAENVAKLTQPV